MTEQPGRRARWTALLLLAPSSAGLFGGAVWWAGHTGPSAASPAAPSAPLVRQPAAAPPTAAADAAADAAASAAASVVRAQQAAVHRRAIQRLHRAQAVNAALERRVARLQHSLQQPVAGPVQPVPTGAPAPVGGGPAPVTAPSPAPVLAAAPPAPAPVAAPPPAPAPPPVQATTGGSQATKP